MLYGVTGVAYSRCLSRTRQKGPKHNKNVQSYSAMRINFYLLRARDEVHCHHCQHVSHNCKTHTMETLHNTVTFVIRQKKRKMHARNKWKGVCVKKLQHFYTHTQANEWGNERRIKDKRREISKSKIKM